MRPDFSAAIRVVPALAKGSSTVSPGRLEFRIARSTHSTGFIVGCVVPHRLIDPPDVALIPIAAPVASLSFGPLVRNRFVVALVIRPAQGKRVLGLDDERRPVTSCQAARRLPGIQFAR